MIRRHFTAHMINTVINDPFVYDWVRGSATGKLDVTPAIEDENNILLMGEYGGVFFVKRSPGVYEAHTQVLRAGRGQWCLDMVNEALTWVFTRTDCVDIITRVPKGNHAARALALAIHGMPEYRIEHGWVRNDEIVPADVYSLQIQHWMATAPPSQLQAEGILFHHRLEQEYARLGKDEQQHPVDPVHDRYVGAAVAMIRNGQAHKAVVFYNRWAGMAGYKPISVVSENPTIVDIQESLIQVTDNGDFFVLRVK